ncbi:MAG TPA: glycosyltransferase family 39 protein [Acetobacteraceae bacterium]|nr:glycosyltransferase family 39 protein [Acetobacteraceae bacterium]
MTAGTAAREPARATILALLAGFVAIWTVYFTLTEAPVPIKHDMLEAYAWGQEFQLGYHQHPPFWAWICGLWFLVFPSTGWAFSLLSSVNAAIGVGGAWLLIGDFARGSKRMAAWALLLLTPLYTVYAYKYDANIIFLSLWPWTLHFFVRSLRSRGLRDTLLLGLFAGFALLSKYYALILLATCFLAALQSPQRRAWFASPAPYVAAAVTVLLCVPHVWWLLNNRAPPVHYLESVSGRSWHHVWTHLGKTLGDAVAMNLGPAAVIALAFRLSRQRFALVTRGSADFPMLVTLVLAPLVLTLAGALVLRTTVTSEMTLGIFPLLPLLAIEISGLRDVDKLSRMAVGIAAVANVGALLLSPAIMLSRTFLSPAAMKQAPLQEVAVAATRLWHARTGLKLRYVAGTAWYENATAFYSPDHPHVFEYFDYAMNLWVTPEDLARHGLLSICAADDKSCLARTAHFVTPATTSTRLTLSHRFLGHVARPVAYVVTIIPPQR